MNQKVGTALGLTITIIIAITTGFFVWQAGQESQGIIYPVSNVPRVRATKDQSAAESKAENINSTQIQPEATTVSDPTWKLISGNPKQNCSRLIYDGSANVRGWYIWDTSYTEKEWMLRIFDEDLKNLPGGLELSRHADGTMEENPRVKIIDAPAELVKGLKAASKDRPVNVTIKGVSIYCEGFPQVSIQSGKQAFQN